MNSPCLSIMYSWVGKVFALSHTIIYRISTCFACFSTTTKPIMPKSSGKQNLTSAEHSAIISMANSSIPHLEIAKTFNCSKRTVCYVLKNHKERGHTEEAPRSGRPPKINPRGLRALTRSMATSRCETLGNITQSLNLALPSPVCNRTVKHALNDQLGMHACHACKKPFLKTEHIEKRMDWARAAERLTEDDWDRVIWTDECSVELGNDSRAPLVWRSPGEEYDPKCLLPTFKSGRSSVMIWGCIAYNCKGPLVFIPKDERTGADYVRRILGGALWDFYMELSEERGLVKVMEDGAPIHTCRVAQEFRDSHQMETFQHPPSHQT